MAVRADDLELRHLGEQQLPVAGPAVISDVERLVDEVIEFEDDWVHLAAVDARVAPEEMK